MPPIPDSLMRQRAVQLAQKRRQRNRSDTVHCDRTPALSDHLPRADRTNRVRVRTRNRACGRTQGQGWFLASHRHRVDDRPWLMIAAQPIRFTLNGLLEDLRHQSRIRPCVGHDWTASGPSRSRATSGCSASNPLCRSTARSWLRSRSPIVSNNRASQPRTAQAITAPAMACPTSCWQ
jgi:hypothetical protein